MQLTQREKYGRNGMNISITRNDYHRLEDLRKLLTLKSRPAVIHFLIERFVEDSNIINKNKEKRW